MAAKILLSKTLDPSTLSAQTTASAISSATPSCAAAVLPPRCGVDTTSGRQSPTSETLLPKPYPHLERAHDRVGDLERDALLRRGRARAQVRRAHHVRPPKPYFRNTTSQTLSAP